MKSRIKKLILSSGFLTKCVMYFRRLRLKKTLGIKYGKNAFIGFSTICEGANGFGAYSSITSSYIGYGSYIAQSTKISKTKIGRYCSIGPNVQCIFGRHPANTFVSTHPSFFALKTPVPFTYAKEQLFKEFPDAIDEKEMYTIKIGNDVWIGANVSILDGVEIGDGAIIAANSLVNKNVAPYTVVGGVPSKMIKKRFLDTEIAFLKEIRWWDKPKDWIANNAAFFTDIQGFIKNIKDD